MEPARGQTPEVVDELVRSALDAAPDGIIVVDGDGRIELANPMASRLFGYGPDELAGQPIGVLVPESVRPGHAQHRADYAADPHTRAMGSGLDLLGRRRSGEEFPVEISLSPVRLGGRLHVISIIRDVTERRAADAELMRAHEQLALVDDRERIARDLHDTVIQRLFAVGLSLQGTLAAVAEPKIADRIETAIDEIDGTIRDLRTAIFSLHTRRMPTTGFRDDVLATTREAGRALGFEPHVVFEGALEAATPPEVREQMIPTLREALSNVVKHSAATRVSVTVKVSSSELVLLVVDNGVGVVSENRGGRGVGNMTERALALGGHCRLHSGDEAGTVVEWRVPIWSTPKE